MAISSGFGTVLYFSVLTAGAAPAAESFRAAHAARTAHPLDVAPLVSAYGKGDYKKAYEIGCLILKQDPGNLTAHYLMGNCYVKFKQIDKAAEEYKYCTQTAAGNQIGKFAQQALDQIVAHDRAEIEGERSKDAAPQYDPAESKGPPLDTLDLQTLEYKERLLKTGEDLIAANKKKLDARIERVRVQAEDSVQNLQAQIQGSPNRIAALAAFGPAREQVMNQAEATIQHLREQNEEEERRITAYYQGQVDKISSQKGNLTTQAQVGKGQLRMVQKGSNLFVRNYINFHGEPPIPPPPPELQATARKLSTDPTGKVRTTHE
jgi:hypothetical protein